MSFSISSFRKAVASSTLRPVNKYVALWCAIAATTFTATWLYVAWMPMAFLSFDYPLWLAKKSMIESCDLGSVAFFGDSRAESAFIPAFMPVKATNLAMSSTSPIETYFTVQRALQCANHPKLVVISHGVVQFVEDPDFWDDGPVIGFLDYAALRDIEHQAIRLSDRRAIASKDDEQSPPWLRDWLYSVRFPPLFFPYILNNYAVGQWSRNKNLLAASMHSRGQTIFGVAPESHNLADEVKLETFQVSPLEDYYFTKTLSLLYSQHVKTVFLTMPINQSTYDEIHHSVDDGFAAYLRGKQQQFSNFQVVGDPLPCWPDEFLGDAFHFNVKGAEAYSRQVGRWLEPDSHDARGELPGGGLDDRCVRPPGPPPAP